MCPGYITTKILATLGDMICGSCVQVQSCHKAIAYDDYDTRWLCLLCYD